MSHDIFEQALRMPMPERALLARELLLSLEQEPFDADWRAAWNEEIEKRLGAVEEGNYTACDWREVLDRIRTRFAIEEPT